VVGIEPPAENKISDFTLYQNYPNPFNPSTVISWLVPSPAQGSDGQAVENWVKLSIYDLSGCEVAVLVNEKQPAGYHQIEFNASGLANGIYMYRIKVGDFIESRKMVLLK
jgi:Secretion system C-terminal sorting domain